MLVGAIAAEVASCEQSCEEVLEGCGVDFTAQSLKIVDYPQRRSNFQRHHTINGRVIGSKNVVKFEKRVDKVNDTKQNEIEVNLKS